MKNNKIKLFSGLILFFLSYLPAFSPGYSPHLWSLGIFCVFFQLGIVLICESITWRIAQKSLARSIFKNKKTFFQFLSITTIGGLGLEAVAQWIGKLWFYPYFSLAIYASVFVGGFALYWLTIIESYFAVKSILDTFRKGKKSIKKYYNFEKIILPILGIIGAILIPVFTLLLLNDYSQQGGYRFNIASTISHKINFSYIILIFLGMWFLAESSEYSQRKTSLLKDIFHHYYVPFFAVLIASFVLAIAWKMQNTTHNFWIYLNWPLENLKILGLPMTMFLAWPLHYIAFISLFRAISDGLSKEVWSGDNIK